MNDTNAEIQRLMDMREEDLYLEIGRHLFGRPAFPVQPAQLLDRAKKWSQEVLPRTVCGNSPLKTLARQDVPTQELILSVCAVLDVASHLLGGVPAVTAAALIVRVGLHRFCASFWERETAG